MQSTAKAPLALPSLTVGSASLIVSYLEAIGVDHVFGVPGGAIEPLYNAMAQSMQRGGLRPIVARHEAGAAFMADGYARETGKVGVCVATSGPGATNLITGVACAFDNCVTMLVISGRLGAMHMRPVFGKVAQRGALGRQQRQLRAATADAVDLQFVAGTHQVQQQLVTFGNGNRQIPGEKYWTFGGTTAH